jgi:ATP synthase F0 subunit b
MPNRRATIKPILLLFVGTLLLMPCTCVASESSGEESAWPLIFKFLNIAIFVAILYKLGAKKIGEFFRERRQRVRGAIEAAAKKEDEAGRLLEEWREKVAQAEEEAMRIVEASVVEGKSLKEKILKEAEEAAKRIVEQAKIAAEEEAKKTREMLGRELAALSAAKAEILLRENLGPEHQERFIEEFLRKLEDIP